MNNFMSAKLKQEKPFAAAQKDLFKIMKKLIENEDIKKLLVYNSSDCLNMKNVSDEDSIKLMNNQIKVVPKIPVSEELKSYILITFDNFMTNENNPQFRDNVVTFDVLCPLEYWSLDGYNLRPFKIMGEIDSVMDGKKLNGIGRAEFVSANLLMLSDDLAGYTLMYRVINDA